MVSRSNVESVRVFYHPEGMIQKLIIADLLDISKNAFQKIVASKFNIVYSDPPWSPGNEKWWRRHANVEPPSNYNNFLNAWCMIATVCSPKHIFVEQSVNLLHNLQFLNTAAIYGNWTLLPRQCWTALYGSPKRKYKIFHFGIRPIVANLSLTSGETPTRLIFEAIRNMYHNKIIVCDPCTGFGMSSRMSHRIRADFIGIELNPKRMERTVNWLLKHGYEEQ